VFAATVAAGRIRDHSARFAVIEPFGGKRIYWTIVLVTPRGASGRATAREDGETGTPNIAAVPETARMGTRQSAGPSESCRRNAVAS
jgi:hypothetical protein